MLGDAVAMSALWTDETGRHARVTVSPNDETDWMWCRGVQFMPSDGCERCKTDNGCEIFHTAFVRL